MITFLRENSYTIVKMLVNQIGMTIFGLMLAMATNTNQTLLLISSVFSILFYMFLLYSMSRDTGAKDKIRVDGGRAKAMPLKGVYMSLCANVINIILAICIIIGFYSASWTETIDEASGSTFMVGDPEWAGNLYGISNMLSGFFSAMYLGVIKIYMPNLPFAYLICVLPSVAACGFGYLMGLHDKRIIKLPNKQAEDSSHTVKRAPNDNRRP